MKNFSRISGGGVVNFTSDDSTNTTSFTSVTALTSGLTLSTLFNRVSTMFKNIRYLYSKITTMDSDLNNINNGLPIITYIGGWLDTTKTSQNFDYPEGFNKDNTCIMGIRCKTPYGTFVDNTYSPSYSIAVVMGQGITVNLNDSNKNYTEFTIHLYRWNA